MSGETAEYDASHMKVLEWPDVLRKRPGMYVGSTGERGLHQLVFEVADRAVSEVVACRASCVDVALMTDGGMRVADDGPGVPVEATGDGSGSGLEALPTRFSGVRPLDRHTVYMGFVGGGPCVTNALSSRLTAEVRREGVRWVHEHARGVVLAAHGPGVISAGQVAGLIEDLPSCAKLVDRVMSEAEEIMAELGAVTPERTPTNNN